MLRRLARAAIVCALGSALSSPSSGQRRTGRPDAPPPHHHHHHDEENQRQDFSSQDSGYRNDASNAVYAAPSGGVAAGAAVSNPYYSNNETAVGYGVPSGSDGSYGDEPMPELADQEPGLTAEDKAIEQEIAAADGGDEPELDKDERLDDLVDEVDPPPAGVKAARASAAAERKTTAAANIAVACHAEKGLFCDSVIDDDVKTARCLAKYRDNVLSACGAALDAWSARLAAR
jgi:hypothetical protein